MTGDLSRRRGDSLDGGRDEPDRNGPGDDVGVSLPVRTLTVEPPDGGCHPDLSGPPRRPAGPGSTCVVIRSLSREENNSSSNRSCGQCGWTFPWAAPGVRRVVDAGSGPGGGGGGRPWMEAAGAARCAPEPRTGCPRICGRPSSGRIAVHPTELSPDVGEAVVGRRRSATGSSTHGRARRGRKLTGLPGVPPSSTLRS